MEYPILFSVVLSFSLSLWRSAGQRGPLEKLRARASERRVFFSLARLFLSSLSLLGFRRRSSSPVVDSWQRPSDRPSPTRARDKGHRAVREGRKILESPPLTRERAGEDEARERKISTQHAGSVVRSLSLSARSPDDLLSSVIKSVASPLP